MQEECLDNSVPCGFTLRHTLRRHQQAIYQMSWSPDGQLLASPSEDVHIRIWNAVTGKLSRVLKSKPIRSYSVA